MNFMENIWNSPIFTWVILPLLIFMARVVDVSIGTLRIAFLARGEKTLAPLLGFFEVLIWLLAIGQIFRHLDNFLCYLGYAGGFAMGNYVGLIMEEKLAFGTQIIRIIVRDDGQKLIDAFRRKGWGVTVVAGKGATGDVRILFAVLKRKEIAQALEILNKLHPQAFYTIEDIHSTREKIEKSGSDSYLQRFREKLLITRKRK